MEKFIALAIEFLLPVFVTVVLPVSIVLIVSLSRKSKYNKRIAFFEKCVENGIEINPQLLGEEQKTPSSLKKVLLNRLMVGVIMSLLGVGMLIWSLMQEVIDDEFVLGAVALIAVGIGMLVWYFVGKKVLAEDIKAEQDQLLQQNGKEN